MIFSEFKNGTGYLEYLQIFIFYSLHVIKKDVDINDYLTFELTDITVKRYNKWVMAIPVDDPVLLWFEKNDKIVEQFKLEFNSIYKPKVCIWSDRHKNQYYKEKLQMGFSFENFIATLIAEKYRIDLGPYLTPEGQYELGENSLGIEIKNDTLINVYGNVYIEFQEKSRSSNFEFINSGILKIDNCVYWLIGTNEKFYIFRKKRLIEIFKEELYKNQHGIPSSRGIKFKQIQTSRGFVYPIANAIANHDTITMDEMMEEIKQRLNV